MEEARRLSAEGERIGRSAHDTNAALLFEVQRNGIDGTAERISDEDFRSMKARAEDSPAAGAWRAALLARLLLLGDPHYVEQALPDEVAALAAAPLDANWLYTAAALGVLAAHFDDAAAAAELYRLLAPYGHRIVTVGRGAACVGSAQLALGLLASTLGDRTAAAEHLEQAVERNDAIGAVAFAAAARRARAGVGDDQSRAELFRGLLWRL